MNEIQEILKFKEILENFEWFEMIDIVDGNFIVYTNKMGLDVFNKIPDMFNNKKVLVHYFASKMCHANNYTKVFDYEDFMNVVEIQQFVTTNLKIYGRTVVGCMFYEVYNPNLEAKVKNKYPHLYIEFENMFAKHGYNSLFKELEKQGIV